MTADLEWSVHLSAPAIRKLSGPMTVLSRHEAEELRCRNGERGQKVSMSFRIFADRESDDRAVTDAAPSEPTARGWLVETHAASTLGTLSSLMRFGRPIIVITPSGTRSKAHLASVPRWACRHRNRSAEQRAGAEPRPPSHSSMSVPTTTHPKNVTRPTGYLLHCPALIAHGSIEF